MSENNRDTIKALSMRNQARTQVDVWFQSRDNMIHPTIEIGINGSDEINNNFDDGEVTFILHDDKKTMTIIDTGRGLPINGESEVEDEDGNMVIKPNYYLLLLKLFSGTNYDNNENGKITTGQHGLGLTVSNYCSEYFNVKSYQNDKMYELEFVNGGELSKDLTMTKLSQSRHGTEITFRLDGQIFTCTEYDIEDIYRVVSHMASVNTKIKFKVIYNDEEKIFHFKSIEDYFDTITSANTSKKLIGLQKEYTYNNEKNYIELIMCTSSEVIQESYLNITHLIEGGTINEGIISGVRSFINKYCKEKNLLGKKSKSISQNDIADSISFVCNFLSTNAEYSNQVKYSTKKELYKKIANEYTQELLEVFKTEQPSEFEKMVKHILEVQKFNTKSNENKNKLKNKLTEKVAIFNKIDGLYEAEEKDPKKRILCICEGKSALSSLLEGKLSIHAIFPLRGKILSCLKASTDSITSNAVIRKLMMTLGFDVDLLRKNKHKSIFDINLLRYNKVYIFVDQDVDGIGSIMPLLLTMFYILTPELIEMGKICVCESPKYEIDYLDEEYFAISDEQLEEVKHKLNYVGNESKFKIHYIKGLSELSTNAMAMCLEEDYENITQITLEDAKKSAETIELFMSNAVEPRKNYILNNFDKIGGEFE